MQVVTEWCTCVWLWTEAMWAGMEEGGAKTGEEQAGKKREVEIREPYFSKCVPVIGGS